MAMAEPFHRMVYLLAASPTPLHDVCRGLGRRQATPSLVKQSCSAAPTEPPTRLSDHSAVTIGTSRRRGRPRFACSRRFYRGGWRTANNCLTFAQVRAMGGPDVAQPEPHT